MSTLSEAQLDLMVKSKVLRRICIHQTLANRFRVSVTLTNQSSELALVTTRKTPREWASLDTLTRHFQEKFGRKLTFTLHLHAFDCTTEQGQTL